MMVHHLTTNDRHHLIHQLPPSTPILLPHHHQVLTTIPSVPASPLADAAAVLTTEDITVITVDHTADHTATNAVADGADAGAEAGAVAEDAGAVNAVPTLGPPAATST